MSWTYDFTKVPSVFIIIKTLLLLAIRFEILNFYQHMLLHLKLFKKLHKVHHEFVKVNFLAAYYSHPIEHIIYLIITFGTGCYSYS